MAGWSMTGWSVIQNTSPSTAAARPNSCTPGNSGAEEEKGGEEEAAWRGGVRSCWLSARSRGGAAADAICDSLSSSIAAACQGEGGRKTDRQ